MKLNFSPSLMCADQLNIQHDLDILVTNGFEMIHLDVMDLHFVPNLTLGFDIVNKLMAFPFVRDIHLMVDKLEIALERLDTRTSDLITFHIEAVNDVNRIINMIKAKGARPGISINPETPVEKIFPYLTSVDMVLLMSIHPGFSGQSFIEDAYSRAEELVTKLKEIKKELYISVDGGIGFEQIKKFSTIGANTFVLGTKSLFKKETSLTENIKRFREFEATLLYF